MAGPASPLAAQDCPCRRPAGVQLIHVDAEGLPALDKPKPAGLPKRSLGHLAGAVCVLGLQGHGGVKVAEGLLFLRRNPNPPGGVPEPPSRVWGLLHYRSDA